MMTQKRPESLGDRAMLALYADPSFQARFMRRKPRVLVVGVGFKKGQPC